MSEDYREAGGFAGGTLQRVIESVAGQNLPDQRQADALAVWLGAEERREQVHLRLGRDPGTRVLDHHFRPTAVARLKPDRNRPVTAGRVDRVLQNVENGLL